MVRLYPATVVSRSHRPVDVIMEPGVRWWPRLLPLLAATIAVGTDAWVVAGFLPGLAHDLQVPPAMAGWSVTVFAVAYAVAAPIVAALTSTIQPRRLITVALIVLAAANLVCALSGGFAFFLLGRVLAAVAASVVTPAAGVLASRAASERHRGRALGLVVAGLTIATAVGVPIGSLLAALTSWRVALLGVAVLATLAGLLILLTAPNVPAGARQRIVERLVPLTQPRVVAVLILTTAGMAAAYIPYAYAGTALPAARNNLVVVLTAYGIGAVGGSLASGSLTDKFGPTRTLTIAYALMALSLAALAVRPSVILVVAMAAVWGASSWMQTPAQQHRLLAAAPGRGPVTIGANASALYIGIACGNGLGGLLLGAGATPMFLVAAGGAVLALSWNLLLTLRTRAPETVR